MSQYRPGPVGAEVLAVLANADGGLTVNALAEAMGRPPEQRTGIDQAVRVLERNGCARILTRVRRPGTAAAVWCITTTGRDVHEQSGEAVAP